jgi:hypothetical protein
MLRQVRRGPIIEAHRRVRACNVIGKSHHDPDDKKSLNSHNALRNPDEALSEPPG